jgi:hypothetical protein
MFTDSIVDRHGQDIPIDDLCILLNSVCLPMAGARITELIQHQMKLKFDHEEILIEMELCISAIFKPFLHYLKRLANNPEHLATVWMSMLDSMTELLKQEAASNPKKYTNPNMSPSAQLNATKQLATEHLRNAIMILMAKGIVSNEATDGNELSTKTWNAIENISYIKDLIPEWKQSGNLEAKA